jgi:cysteine-rich repeat protein
VTRFLVAGVALSIVLGAGPAGAQPAGPEFQVNAYTTGAQRFVPYGVDNVAVDGAGNYIVVWESADQDGSGFAVVGRRFDPMGAPLGPEFQVNTQTAGDQFGPAVAAHPSGSFVVAWEGAPDGGIRGVAARRYDASGAPLGPEFQVNVYTTLWQDAPHVAVDGAGNFVITWHSPQEGTWDSFMRIYDSAGTPQTGEIRVNQYSPDFQSSGSIGTDAAGNIVNVFLSIGQDGSDGGIFARKFTSAGVPLGPEFPVNTFTAGHQHFPHVAVAAAGGFVATWGSFAPQDGSGYGIFGRRFDAAGAPLGAEFQVNTYTTGRQYAATVAGGAAGDFVVVWQSAGQDGSGDGIFGQRYDAAGVPVGGEFAVNTYVNGDQRQPLVASSGGGSFLVAWESTGQDGSGAGIFAQAFGLCGNGQPDPGEACDDGNQTNGDGCEATCTPTGCGDGSIAGAETCDDGNIRNGDCCSSACTLEANGSPCPGSANGCIIGRCDTTGTCMQQTQPGGMECLDDGDICTADRCDGVGGCVHDGVPQAVCRAPTRSGLGVFRLVPPRLTWRWPRGEPTDAAAFGSPFTPEGTDYALCVYDASAAPQPVMRVRAPAGGSCLNGFPCWREQGTKGGIDYNDRLGDSDPDGLRQIIMEAGASRSRILARGLGPLLPFPFVPLVPPVTVQLRGENGECWGAVYSQPRINDGVQFKANPD